MLGRPADKPQLRTIATAMVVLLLAVGCEGTAPPPSPVRTAGAVLPVNTVAPVPSVSRATRHQQTNWATLGPARPTARR